MKIAGTLLTHLPRFPRAVRTMQWLGGLDRITVVLPRGQCDAFRRAADQSKDPLLPLSPYRVVEHDIQQRTSNGAVRYGALKEYQFDVLRDDQGLDLALQLDDDLAQRPAAINLDQIDRFRAEQPLRNMIARRTAGRPWHELGTQDKQRLREHYHFVPSSFPLSTLQLAERVRRAGVAALARSNHGFFTFVYGARSNNTTLQQRTTTPTIKWSGVLGVLPGTPNPYDSHVMTTEDYDAAGRILCDYDLRVWADPSTVFHMDIGSSKYQENGCAFSERRRALQRLVDRYHWRGHAIFRLRHTTLGRIPSVECPPQVMKLLRNEVPA